MGVVAHEPAPSDGPVAPSNHSAPANSLLNLAGRWMSETSSQSTSGAAATTTSASTVAGSRQ